MQDAGWRSGYEANFIVGDLRMFAFGSEADTPADAAPFSAAFFAEDALRCGFAPSRPFEVRPGAKPNVEGHVLGRCADAGSGDPNLFSCHLFKPILGIPPLGLSDARHHLFGHHEGVKMQGAFEGVDPQNSRIPTT